MPRLLFVILLMPGALFSQSEKKPDVWQPWKFFVGAWEGGGKGQSGDAKVEREYQFVLNGKYLQVRNKSTYAPQEKNPKGEAHEDWGLISRDGMRKKFVLRQFHVEGFVNQYALDSLAVDGKAFVFVTESIENIPAGWRARETYTIINENEFVERFELAEPEKAFAVYSESHLKRKK